MAITLVIAAPSALTGEVLCRALNNRRKQFKVLGCTNTKKDFLEQVAEHRPDVVLIDARLERHPTAGLQALRELRLPRSSTNAILLVDCSEPGEVIQAFAHGARGVICKTEPLQVLCKCIRSVHAGQVWADSSQLRWVLRALRGRETFHMVNAKGSPLLTDREEQIVRLIVEGLPSREISTKLGLSPHTIKNHLFRIYNKLGISTRAELMLYALASRDVPHGGNAPPEQPDT